MVIRQIRKRDGLLAAFDATKIAAAIEKAMRAVRGRVDTTDLTRLTNAVVQGVEERFGDRTPDVEGVQDIVERVLMEQGWFDVARGYILYRERHRERREERRRLLIERLADGELLVTKRGGEAEPFDERKLRATLAYAVRGFEGVVDVDDLLHRCIAGLYEGIDTDGIGRLATLTARAHIEDDPAYEAITARLFQISLVKEVVGSKFSPAARDDAYRKAFVRNLKRGVEIGRLVPQLLEFDLDHLAAHLDVERDWLLPFRGLQTLYDRYLMADGETEQRLESPQAFWMRVAMGLSLNEDDKNGCAVRFYDTISTLRFVPSTPTLFHSGTNHPQMSSCYITTVDDDLSHIFKCLGDNAQLSKWSGGLGNDWTNVRATGAQIKSTGVESQGVIPFLKIANDATAAINRSGKRRGATCAYLEMWHMDIEDFLDLRRNTGDERRRTHDMNTAVWIPDLFMKRVHENGTWTLFSPDETPDLHDLYGSAFEDAYVNYERAADEKRVRLHKKVNALDLWKKTLTRLYETGHPWITFKDACNVRSPQDHAGVVRSSNLCTEITLNTSRDETAVCNLGSMNLAAHVRHDGFDEERLGETVATAMRMLDNVIDLNFYPTKEAEASNLRHRPVGLGIMGFQDALFALDVPFDSERAVEIADESMELVAYHAIRASSELAAERGTYASYEGSKWDRGIFPQDTLDLLEAERGVAIPLSRDGKLDWSPVRDLVRQHGVRNSNCLAIAPTATISNIAGVFPSIEPIYKNLYVKSNMSGEFTVVNRHLVEDLKALGLWNRSVREEIKQRDGSIQGIDAIPAGLRAKYQTSFEIKPEWYLQSAARRGKWMDQSQSLNVFIDTNSGRRLSEVYTAAWRLGLKTTYYLRTLGASGVEKSTVELR
ncbi:MAG: ribonucleoside-diphosphate reductase subunit alpha, partial [Candidatus Poribacteria bacterium]|nr:ribonucleoside-diphosphate reductase subunit alpha [Candidatus Poribacteria bacterium]